MSAVTHHAIDRAAERGIAPADVELIRRHGHPTWNGRSCVLSLAGVKRPAHVAADDWRSARSVVVVQNGGVIVTVWREGGR